MQRVLVGGNSGADSADQSAAGDRVPDEQISDSDTGDASGSLLTTEEIYRRHSKNVSRWARALLGPDADLEDVVHDVFMVVHRRLHEFRGDAQISTWLFAITVRTAKHRRRINRLRRYFLPWRKEAEVALRNYCSALKNLDDVDTPAGHAERREAQRILYQLLDGLDEKHRTALILSDVEGLGGREIAEITNTTDGNVWVRINRGRAELLKAYQAFEAKGTSK